MKLTAKEKLNFLTQLSDFKSWLDVVVAFVSGFTLWQVENSHHKPRTSTSEAPQASEEGLSEPLQSDFRAEADSSHLQHTQGKKLCPQAVITKGFTQRSSKNCQDNH